MRLLALRRQLGSRSGNDLAVTLLQVVKEWGIENHVGVVVSENATTNDTCLHNFYQTLDPDFKPRREAYAMSWSYLEPGRACLPVWREL
jgi:hypothetical protein